MITTIIIVIIIIIITIIIKIDITVTITTTITIIIIGHAPPPSPPHLQPQISQSWLDKSSADVCQHPSGSLGSRLGIMCAVVWGFGDM